LSWVGFRSCFHHGGLQKKSEDRRKKTEVMEGFLYLVFFMVVGFSGKTSCESSPATDQPELHGRNGEVAPSWTPTRKGSKLFVCTSGPDPDVCDVTIIYANATVHGADHR
jgi:hypothetical protein